MSSVYASELSQMCQTRVLMRAVERTRSELPDVLPGSIFKSEVGFVACSALQCNGAPIKSGARAHPSTGAGSQMPAPH
jgi:hypothetical protein